MTIDGLYFPDKIQNLTKATSFDELKVSTGKPRYYKDKSGFWGFNLGNCGLTQEDWDEIQNNNIYVIDQLKVVHLGNRAGSKTPNTQFHMGLSGKKSLIFADISHNSNLESIWGKEGAPALEKIIASDCPKLQSLNLTSEFPKLECVEVARSGLKEAVLEGKFPKLRFVELSHNKLESLSIPASCKALEYLFAQNNQLKTIDFNGKIPPLEIFDLKENPVYLNDDLRPLLEKQGDAEALKEIVAFFERQKQGNTKTIERVKLIFLGNTRVGKTTLSDILTGGTKAIAKNPEDDPSTYGINMFSYKPQNTEIEVQGFDFGGQDYFHNTHFAFFEANALYILLWGNGQENTLHYNRKNERCFPLNYWLGSVKFFTKTESRKNPASVEVLMDELKPIPSDESVNNEISSELHLLQNIPESSGKILDLDNLTLKSDYPFIRDISAFCLRKESGKVAAHSWLDEKIKGFAKAIPVNLIDYEVTQYIKNTGKVVLPVRNLKSEELNTEDYNDEQLKYLVRSLHRTLACFFTDLSENNDEIGKATILTPPQKKALSENIIADLERFTDWIYTILAPEMKSNGYFTQKQAVERLSKKGLITNEKDELDRQQEFEEAKGYIDYILAFMLHHKIIFRAGEIEEEISVGKKVKVSQYIAPHYLSENQTLTEQLFLSSFESPLVKYWFREFFHTNLATEVMLKFYDELLKDSQWNFVLWKNKVILYEENDTKKLLLIDFEEEEVEKTKEKTKEKVKEKIASIRLHRFVKNAVSDDFVKEVMAFIESQIENYEYTKLIVTPFSDYMPEKCLEQENVNSEGKDEGLVYHGNKIYRKADFKLFLKNPDAYPKKRLFISYSSQNSEFFKRFLVHLAPLQRMGIVDYWHDRMITNGTLWDEKIQKELESSDIVVFLLSPDFLNVPYVLDVEIPKAKEFKKHPFFIQLMDCGWQRFDTLNQYQNASDQKQTNKNFINLKGNPNDSATWEKIIDDLKSTIENLTPKKNAPTN